jgi:hypothetical protein
VAPVTRTLLSAVSISILLNYPEHRLPTQKSSSRATVSAPKTFVLKH